MIPQTNDMLHIPNLQAALAACVQTNTACKILDICETVLPACASNLELQSHVIISANKADSGSLKAELEIREHIKAESNLANPADQSRWFLATLQNNAALTLCASACLNKYAVSQHAVKKNEKGRHLLLYPAFRAA